MFSLRQKQEIAEKLQQVLRETNHPELPKGEISFNLHVDGAESWSWADIKNNGFYITREPSINKWNEMQDITMNKKQELVDLQVKRYTFPHSGKPEELPLIPDDLPEEMMELELVVRGDLDTICNLLAKAVAHYMLNHGKANIGSFIPENNSTMFRKGNFAWHLTGKRGG